MREPTIHPPPLPLAAFTRVVHEQQHALHTFLRGLVGHEEQARDLVQDTFQAAWRLAQRGDPPFAAGAPEDEVRRWLFHTAYCRGISALRRRRLIRWESLDGHARVEAEPAGPVWSFEDRIAEGEALRAALARLAPTDAACLLLRVVQGFSAAEVGRIVGASPDVVHKRLSRAKRRLRAAYLAQDAQQEEPVTR